MPDQEFIETTRLLHTHQPPYVFGSSLARKRRVRQFQCCLWSILLVGFLASLVITIAYTTNLPVDSENGTASTSNETDFIAVDTFITLFNNTWPLEDHVEIKTNDSSGNWDHAMQEGKMFLDSKDSIEKNTSSLPIDSPSYRHQRVMGTSDKARELNRKGYQLEGAARFLYGRNQTKSRKEFICPANYSDPFLREMCSNETTKCNGLIMYRSYNGTCNNMKYPNTYGVAYRPFRRAIQPDYADDISKPRESKNGPLPSARTISLEVHRTFHRDDVKFSVMVAVWGQFLDHDITATALSQKENGSSISCCVKNEISSPDCFPVFISNADPLSMYNVTCMEFVRSAPSPQCCLGPREQMNQASAFIDGSVVYGSDESKALSLRTMSKGLLKMYITEDNRTLLPISDDMSDGCNREDERSQGRYCFLSGDSRANENLHLTSMHLIWARQHNFLAKNLASSNPHWSDERVFQETRRIIAAQMQHITYNEFLPILLGKTLMKKNGLLPKSKGYFDKYNASIDASIANEFAAAAFRFAHTLIPGLVKTLASDTSNPEYIQMHKMLFNPFQLYQSGELDSTIKGAMNTSIEASDSYFTDELKSHLFERDSEQHALPRKCGLDLVSLNIQRGRDHGLPGYVFWKEHCGFKISKTFEDLEDIMEAFSLQNIKAVYRYVEDIDLYTGALSEKPLKGSILGPTLTCLILDQFIRLKNGDRFWYENPQPPYSFSPEQLEEIRKTTLARVICDNADNLDTIQPQVMHGLTRNNENIPCSNVSTPNWLLWKENLHYVGFPTQRMNVRLLTNG